MLSTLGSELDAIVYRAYAGTKNQSTQPEISVAHKIEAAHVSCFAAHTALTGG